MNTRLLILLAASGALTTTAAAQYVRHTLTFLEVTAGTNNPVPNPNGILEPGEAARLSISVDFTPAVGTTLVYTPPPPPGIGTVAGLNGFDVDILSLNQFPVPTATGTWTFAHVAPGWDVGSLGTPYGGGWTVRDIVAGQFVPPGTTANPMNPIPDIWQAVWTPTSYSPRTENWTVENGSTAQGTYNKLLLQYGVGPAGEPLYMGMPVSGVYSPIAIPIIPAPPTLALAASALLARRRRPQRRP